MLSATSLSGTTRNNVAGWVGCRITVGTDPLAVTELGRWVASGNSLIHTLKLVRAVDGVDVAGAQVTVNNSGVSSGHLLYGTLPSPVVLEANTTYYLVSQETSGGDLWYDSSTTVSALTGVTVPGAILYSGSSWTTAGSANNSYGPMGFKAAPVTWNVTKETRYVYDGMLAIQERDGSNTPQVSYTRGKDLSGGTQGAGGIGGLLGYTCGGVSHFYHSDGLGNVTALLNVGNQLSATYNYDPYGNLLSSAGPMADANPYRFSSKEFHGPSGTYAYGYRFYDPNLQRWLNRDPIGVAGGLNLYQFGGSTPTYYVDTDGRFLLPAAGLGALAGAVWGGGMAYVNGDDVWQGAFRGAVIGGIAGLTAGIGTGGALAAAGLSFGTATVGEAAVAGAFGSMLGDMTGQAVEGALGWRCGYSPSQTLAAGALGGGLSAWARSAQSTGGAGGKGGGGAKTCSAPSRKVGGAYGDISANGGEVHHTPADSVSTLAADEGPAIWMEKVDHRQTASHGTRGLQGQLYRAQQAELIEQGRFDDAIQMDINDIQSKFGDKYNEGIEQMLQYYKSIPDWKLKMD
ncbi:MAG TPA: RHS repeat-associated core domain-containing protein, partial [Candidatus Limnocylindria bacterium]|jgi:RHS repeat-associated protein|nr:RHS repeat-associated core domain-containing protein [Candidatus Limnocylindria bacterium]